MASSEDYKKLYELYQVEGVPNGISIVDFCQRNGIVYKHFERWFKKRYSQNDTGDSQGEIGKCGFISRSVFIRGARFCFPFQLPKRRTGSRSSKVVCYHSNQSRPFHPTEQPNLDVNLGI